jgi:hypothetical protein
VSAYQLDVSPYSFSCFERPNNMKLFFVLFSLSSYKFSSSHQSSPYFDIVCDCATFYNTRLFGRKNLVAWSLNLQYAHIVQGYSKRSIYFQEFILQVLLNIWRHAIYTENVVAHSTLTLSWQITAQKAFSCALAAILNIKPLGIQNFCVRTWHLAPGRRFESELWEISFPSVHGTWI